MVKIETAYRFRSMMGYTRHFISVEADGFRRVLCGGKAEGLKVRVNPPDVRHTSWIITTCEKCAKAARARLDAQTSTGDARTFCANVETAQPGVRVALNAFTGCVDVWNPDTPETAHDTCRQFADLDEVAAYARKLWQAMHYTSACKVCGMAVCPGAESTHCGDRSCCRVARKMGGIKCPICYRELPPVEGNTVEFQVSPKHPSVGVIITLYGTVHTYSFANWSHALSHFGPMLALADARFTVRVGEGF